MHSGRETMYSNGSLLLHNVTLSDTGFYTLRTLSRDLKIKLTHVQLQVNISLSICCNSLTSAPLTIEPVPRNAAKGQSILLLVHNLPDDLRTFSWYKGMYSVWTLKMADYSRAMNYITWEPAYRGREMVYPNGSLLLQGITEKDAGFYALQTSNRDFKIEKADVQLHVKKPVTEPFLRVTDTTVTVQSSVVFSCLSADTGISIRWIFNNQSLHLTERMTLSPTKCGLSIDPVRREDVGQYKSSLLMCGHLPTTAKITIEIVPPQVVEGENVLLHVHNLPENLIGLTWFKEITNMNHAIASYEMYHNQAFPGYGHSGRETVYRNGSLWIQNVTQNDSGVYILRGNIRNVERLSSTYIYLHVYKNLRALFWYKGITVFKNHEIGRHIIAKNSSVPGPAHSGRVTVYSNGSLLLHGVSRKDTGFYTLLTLTTDLKTEVAHVQLQLDTSLSPCCNALTSAPVTIEPVPRNAAKGESILLLVHNLPEDLRTFSWYKLLRSTQISKIAEYNRVRNSITRGPLHSGRTTVYTNGSLFLQDVTEKDAGFYTLETLNRDFKTYKTHVEVHVNPVGEGCGVRFTLPQQAFPVMEMDDPNNPGQRVRYHQTLTFKGLRGLKEAVAAYGALAPLTLAMVESYQVSNLTPGDWQQLARAALTGGDYLLWKGEFFEQCSQTAHMNAQGEFPQRTLDMLFGQGQYATIAAQVNYDPAVYAQIGAAAVRAWKALSNKVAGDKLSKVVQGSSEPYSKFVSHLLQLAGKILVMWILLCL
ncbi:hypothetical protein STEG23_031714 [Scotinomys teguina]